MSAAQNLYLGSTELRMGILDLDWITLFVSKWIRALLILLFPIVTLLLELDVKDITPAGLE